MKRLMITALCLRSFASVWACQGPTTETPDDLAILVVYEIPDPLRFAGEAAHASRLAALTPDSLIERQGCTVHLRRRADGTFSGATRGSDSASAPRGTAHATSEVWITARRIISSDRGYGSDGRQVWSATAGGFGFDKRVPLAPQAGQE